MTLQEKFEKRFCYNQKLGAVWSYPTTPQTVWNFFETESDKRYELGYQDGENSGHADVVAFLDSDETDWKKAIETELEERKVTGDTSDGYHTFNELYEFRKLYNAALFNEWQKQDKYMVHKSKAHADGELCFGGGWFIVMAQLPTGQISNHYEMKDWDLFQVNELDRAAQWDGHTPQDVAKRLLDFLTKPTHMKDGEMKKQRVHYQVSFTGTTKECQEFERTLNLKRISREQMEEWDDDNEEYNPPSGVVHWSKFKYLKFSEIHYTEADRKMLRKLETK